MLPSKSKLQQLVLYLYWDFPAIPTLLDLRNCKKEASASVFMELSSSLLARILHLSYRDILVRNLLLVFNIDERGNLRGFYMVPSVMISVTQRFEKPPLKFSVAKYIYNNYIHRTWRIARQWFWGTNELSMKLIKIPFIWSTYTFILTDGQKWCLEPKDSCLF